MNMEKKDTPDIYYDSIDDMNEREKKREVGICRVESAVQ